MPGKSKKGGGLETKKYAFNMGGDYNTSNKAKRAGKLATKADKAEKAGKLKKAARLNKKSDKLYIKENPEPAMLMKDLSGDGKITQKDVLIGAGVLNKDGSKAKPANEMKGYQMKYKMVNKKGFEMAGNPAMKFTGTNPNLSLMNDPNLSGLDDLPGTGDNVNFEGENMNVLGVDVNKIFKNETTYTPPTITPEGDKWYASLTPEQKAFYDNKYIKENTKPTGNKVLDSFNAVVSLGGIPQPGTPEVKGDAFTTYDKRQRRRGILFEDNAIKRAESKLGRTTARQDYLDTKTIEQLKDKALVEKKEIELES